MTTYEVSRDLLEENLKLLKKKAKSVPIWAVVKGDGYGLGVLPLAELLYRQGITRFCITEVREAEILRENGYEDVQILMLRSLEDPVQVNRLMDLKVILTVGSMRAAELANRLARERGDIAEVHLKVDTGMGRYGFLPEDVGQMIFLYEKMKYLAITGIFTHFNCAFSNKKLTYQEFSAFQSVVATIRASGHEVGTVHCCNSAAFLKYPEMHCDGVRLGSALLGRVPFRTKLRPVGYVSTQVETLRTLPQGHTTGYSALWRAKKDTPIAILPVGWFHGFNVSCAPDQSRRRDNFRSALSSLKGVLRPRRVSVEVNGKKCPLVGAIGMLHCAVDVSKVDCKPGDPVVMQLNPLHVKGMKIVFR